MMSKKNNDSNALAIIGASGAGKTVLAIGLYATSMPAFTVSSIGDETRKYIEVRQNALSEGYWPAATNESDNIDLRLRLYVNGTQMNIVFREYMGERMEKDPNYICDVVGSPKIAMLLFNPGMPGLQSAESRNRMLGNLKAIAEHLKDNGCVAVALVVTASDRLVSDLAYFRDEFEQYVSLITNHLGTLRLNWKRFDVTVSGELANQDRPTLAYGKNNTTHKPFLWLLDRISIQKAKGRIKKTFAWAAGVILGILVGWGSLWVKSKLDLSEIVNEIDGIEAQLAEAWETANEAEVRTHFVKLQDIVTNSLPRAFKIAPGNPETARVQAVRLSDNIDLWTVRLLALEYGGAKHDCENNPLKLQGGWVKSLDDRLTVFKPTATSAIEELAALKDMWQKNRPSMEEKWQVAKFKDEVKRMVVELGKAKVEDIPARLKKGYDFLGKISSDYPLIENSDALSGDLRVARSNALEKYCAFVTNWKPADETRPIAKDAFQQHLKGQLLGAISDAEFKHMEVNLLARLEIAQAEWDKYQFPKRAQEHINTLKAGSEPISALKESRSFLGSMANVFPTISPAERLQKQDVINQARKEALDAYSASIAGKWNVNGKLPPEFDVKQVLSTELTDAVITSDEAKVFEESMQVRFEKAKGDWLAAQKKMCESFISHNLNSMADVPDSLNKYMEFYITNRASPFLKDVDRAMVKLLETRLDWLVGEYYRNFRSDNAVWLVEANRARRMQDAQDQFNELRRLCLAIKNEMLDGSAIQSSWVNRFASLCIEHGGIKQKGINAAFPQEFKMSAIEVKVDFDSIIANFEKLALGIEIGAGYWNDGVKDSMAESLVANYHTSFSKNEGGRFKKCWTGSRVFYLNPWTLSCVLINSKAYIDWDFFDPEDYFPCHIWSECIEDGRIEFQARLRDKDNNARFSGQITIRIYGTLTGFDLGTLLEKAKGN